LLATETSVTPEIDECVEIRLERIGRQLDDVLVEHVRVERTEEEAGGGAGVGEANRAGIAGAGEVRLDDPQGAARRRAVGLAIERQPDLRRMLVHVHRDHRRDDARQERHQLGRQPFEHDARILGAAERIERVDARRQLDVAGLHRLDEEMLLRLNVSQQRRRRDVQLAGDVRQSGSLESLPREDAPGGLEQLLALDRWRPSHL